jgi:hypothetical protein
MGDRSVVVPALLLAGSYPSTFHRAGISRLLVLTHPLVYPLGLCRSGCWLSR